MDHPTASAPVISHLAIWSRDIERLRAFYERHFGAKAGPRYENAAKRFSSYFLSFGRGPRLELMQVPGLGDPTERRVGYAHLALSVGSEDRVIEITETLRQAGVTIAGEPRRTGDGYFESVIRDPDGNAVEITV